tara:strand:- start:298 stop:642 length:345 start_codon:yes stop_codon:yes gene_type:complete
VGNLAVMAEIGKLQAGIHYKFQQGEVAMRLLPCLAEFRRFHKETQLQSELLDNAAYRKQIRENLEREGYITASSELVRFTDDGGSQAKRAVIINIEQAEEAGLDLSGFISSISY